MVFFIISLILNIFFLKRMQYFKILYMCTFVENSMDKNLFYVKFCSLNICFCKKRQDVNIFCTSIFVEHCMGKCYFYVDFKQNVFEIKKQIFCISILQIIIKKIYYSVCGRYELATKKNANNTDTFI